MQVRVLHAPPHASGAARCSSARPAPPGAGGWAAAAPRARGSSGQQRGAQINVALSSSGQDTGLSRRRRGFDSRQGHHIHL